MRTILFAALLPLAALTTAAERLPVEVFAQPAAFSRMTLAWDGKYVAYVTEYESEERVFIRNIDDPKEVLGVDAPKAGASLFGKINGISWISPQRLLIASYSGYLAIDRDGKDYTFLTGSARTYGVNRKDNQYITAGSVIRAFRTGNTDQVLLAEYDRPSGDSRTGWVALRTPNVIKMNTRTAVFTREIENPGDIAGWLADRDGQVRVALKIKNDKRWVLYRSTEKAEWRELRGMGDNARTGDVLGFNGDGTRLYVTKLAANGRYAIHLYDPEQDETGDLLLGHEVYDISPANRASLIHATDGRLLGIRYATDLPRTLWLDEKLAAIQQTVDQVLPGALNYITGITDDEQLMLIISSSARNPGTYYLFDAQKNQLGKFVDACPWIDPATMAEMLPLRFKARDGLQLHGYLTVPPGKEMRQLPLVVIPHGGPWTRDHYGFDPQTQFLANRGYAVLKVNYRGSPGYGPEFYEKGFRQVGAGMQEDIEDAVRWVIGRGIADPKRIAIMGGSFGGYSALMGLIRTPDLYRCGINIAGVTNWNDIIKHSSEMSPESYAFNAQRIGDPKADREMLQSISPVNLVDKIQAPLLIVHGRDDPVVPYDQAAALMKALDRAGKPYETLVKYNEPHGINNYKNRIELYNRIEAFLAQHMPAD